jgi:hypothetical protein
LGICEASSESLKGSTKPGQLHFSAKTRSIRTIAFVGKANAKKADESGFPDEGKNFPDRPI